MGRGKENMQKLLTYSLIYEEETCEVYTKMIFLTGMQLLFGIAKHDVIKD